MILLEILAMFLYTVLIYILILQTTYIAADHQLIYTEISASNSTRYLKINNESSTIRFGWINQENETEPKWR